MGQQHLVPSNGLSSRKIRVSRRFCCGVCGHTTVPESIDFCLEMCLQRYRDLLNILENLLASPKHWRQLLDTFKEHELLTIYNGFRDSVLLLWDLSTKCVDSLPQTFFCEPDSTK